LSSAPTIHIEGMPMAPKRSRSSAVREDGVSPTGSRRAPTERTIDRPSKEAPLETYEQPAARQSDDPGGRATREEDRPDRPAQNEP
jgi:hypothetical protein